MADIAGRRHVLAMAQRRRRELLVVRVRRKSVLLPQGVDTIEQIERESICSLWRR
jgi:hypothetical protein